MKFEIEDAFGAMDSISVVFRWNGGGRRAQGLFGAFTKLSKAQIGKLLKPMSDKRD